MNGGFRICSRFVLLVRLVTRRLTMSQRFKEASSTLSNFVDQLAEEQNRLRAQQATQPTPTSSGTAPRRPNGKSRSGISTPRTQRGSSEDTEKGINLSGPDPDPATFETETAADEKIGLKQEIVPDSDPTSTDVAAQTEKSIEASDAPQDTPKDGEAKDTSEIVPVELSSEVQMKLRKLQKVESKYQGTPLHVQITHRPY